MNEEDLILFYYGELEPEKSEAMVKAMEASPELQLEYAKLCELMDATLTEPVPQASVNLNQNIMSAIHRLEPESMKKKNKQQDASSQWQWLPLFKGSFAFGISMALIMGAFFLGRWSGEPPVDIAQQPVFSKQDSQRILLANISSHLDSSDRLLTVVSNGNGDIAQQIHERRQIIEELVVFNRLYRRIVENNGDKQLLATLQQIESILIELNNNSEQIPGNEEYNDLKLVKERLHSTDLLFKLRITNNNLKRNRI
ncbi:hypothetical protein [Pleionea sp. CnH1-48]|uniref:hypothetical protein n=1 Tax=Pleionea sp. CnH1-48 TaxID=2954494 RepID=UPI00209789DF|nr:hypothetical protein [Pleionea sp. CnH1-48]MCO7225574.1 hypothetical protein [Pleionea sp. CnH1-48]